MTTWFTSDHHWGHANIIKYCDRPYNSIEEMDEDLIKRWNERVQPGDLVYHLGDFAFHKDLLLVDAILDRLNGTIQVIYGNHDRPGVKMSGKFAWKGDYKYVSVEKQKIVLFHYAMRVWRSNHHGSWMLYGHSHGTLPDIGGKTTDVGVDSWDYYPVPFEDLKALMESRKIQVVDHHEGLEGLD